MSVADLLAEDRRLAMLLLLDQSPASTANDSILHSALPEIGHRCSRDQVRGDLAWLAEQGLIGLEAMVGGRVMVASLTAHGADVAAGRSLVPGVKRPSPG